MLKFILVLCLVVIIIVLIGCGDVETTPTTGTGGTPTTPVEKEFSITPDFQIWIKQPRTSTICLLGTMDVGGFTSSNTDVATIGVSNGCIYPKNVGEVKLSHASGAEWMLKLGAGNEGLEIAQKILDKLEVFYTKPLLVPFEKNSYYKFVGKFSNLSASESVAIYSPSNETRVWGHCITIFDHAPNTWAKNLISDLVQKDYTPFQFLACPEVLEPGVSGQLLLGAGASKVFRSFNLH